MRAEAKKSNFKNNTSSINYAKINYSYLNDKQPQNNCNKESTFKSDIHHKEQSKSLLSKHKSSFFNISTLSNTKSNKDTSIDNKQKVFPSITIKKIALNTQIQSYMPSSKDRNEDSYHNLVNKLMTNTSLESPKFKNTNNYNNPLSNCKDKSLGKEYTITPDSQLNTEMMNLKKNNRFRNVIQEKDAKDYSIFNFDTDKSLHEKSIKRINDKNKSYFPDLNLSKTELKKKRNEVEVNRLRNKKKNQRNKLNSLISEQYLNTVANFDPFSNWKKQSKESKENNNKKNQLNLIKSNGNNNAQYPKMISSSPINYQHYHNNYYQKKYANSIVKTHQKSKQLLTQLNTNTNYSNTIYNNDSHNSIICEMNNKKPTNENCLVLYGKKRRKEHSLSIHLPYSQNTNNEVSHHTNTNDDDSSSFIHTKNLFKTFNILDEFSDEISNSTTHNTNNNNNNRPFNLPIAKAIRSTKPNISSYSLIKLGEKRLKTDSSLFISDISKSFSSNKTELFDIDKEESFSPCFARPIPNFFALTSITIKVLSTWGNSKWFGLNSLKLFDKNNTSIDILKIKYGDLLVLNALKQKRNSSESLPLGQFIENSTMIDLYYSSLKEVKLMSIFNYNGLDTSIGIKDIEIYRRHLLIWKGQIKEGNSNISLDQVIQFNSIELLSEVDESEVQRTKLKHRFDINTNLVKTMASFETKQFKLKAIKRNTPISLPKGSLSSKPYMKIMKQISMTSKRLIPNIFPANILQLKMKNPIRKSTQTANSIRCKKIKIILKDNYGNRKHIGLTGIQLINNLKEVINIESAIAIGAFPKDLSTQYGNNDSRIFENLFNGINETIDEGLMWLTMKDNSISTFPFIEIAFDSYINISAIVIWNYNKEDELDKGVKLIELLFDDVSVNEFIVLRKGIGEESVNYSQTILFPFMTHHYSEEELEPFKTIKLASMLYEQHFEMPYLPTGFIFKFVFVSNWGDKYLIGFNSLLLYDQLGRLIHLNKSNIKIISFPNDKDNNNNYQLQSHSDDSNRHNDNTNPNLAYIAPFANFETAYGFNPNSSFSSFKALKGNSIYVLFERPVTVSYIKITNHAIKPERGIKQTLVYCDDKMIFNGEILKYDYALNKGEAVVLFTCDMTITKNIKDNSLPNTKSTKQYKCVLKKESISLIND